MTKAATPGDRKMINGKPHVARLVAYCCIEGSGRIEGCSCVKPNHDIAWYPEAASK